MLEIPEYIRLEAKKELARRLFYDYCAYKYPKFYTADRAYLKTLCRELQAFVEQNKQRFLIINMPPRHGKSFTAKNFTEWLFGQDPTNKVMTGSYNETLSTTFARQVRNTIEERKTDSRTVYNDLFPETKVKYGEASANIWSLEGSEQKSYLATSPTGTATGFGAKYLLIDDIIKNDQEAFSELVLEKHFSWFTNTMMQRTEGDNWKVIVIMTRWATNDLAGQILENYDDVKLITFKAVQDDGTMLCDSVLNKNDYKLKTKNMANEIVQANYNQKPIDLEGRLYKEFMTYEQLPKYSIKYNYTDTADKGADYLCSVNYVVYKDEVYVTGVVMTDQPMEETEPLVAQLLHDDQVNEATIESNNGGRGFARNIERLLIDQYKTNKTVIFTKNQTANKEARILASSAWVQQHVYMPENWRSKYPEFYQQTMTYMKKGKNKHDDSVDVLAAIYEKVANEITVELDADDVEFI